MTTNQRFNNKESDNKGDKQHRYQIFFTNKFYATLVFYSISTDLSEYKQNICKK